MSFENQILNHFFGDIENVQDRLERMRLRNAKNKFVKEFKGHDFENVVIKRMDSICVHGLTHNGLVFSWYVNSGYNERSRYCGRLLIDNKCVFTSGSISKVAPYIAIKKTIS